MYKPFRSFLLGRNLIGITIAFTLAIWLTTLSNYSFIRNDPLLFCSKMTALSGVICLVWAFLLSTRLLFFETMFCGLDKAYRVHRILGTTSFCLICLHAIFQFIRFMPRSGRSFSLFRVYNLGSVEMGVLALLLFTLLVFFTFWRKLPYHIWKKSHEFFIFVLLLGFSHTLWINKQVNDSLFLSIWVYGFIFLAAISYIYIRFLYWHIGPRYNYNVAKIEKIGKVWNVYLDADEKKIQYQPAQFLYVSFENPLLSKEPHPFSVSSSPGQDYLRISIKAQGDYTSKLGVLRLKDKALIWGPYGRFYEKFLIERKRDVVMIGAGIGIAPFLSMLHFENSFPNQRKIHLFYCIQNQTRAYFDEEIKSLSSKNSWIHYVPWHSDERGLMDAESMHNIVGGNLQSKFYFLCGPIEMMRKFISQFHQNGIKNKQIIFEDFNVLD